MSTIDQVLSHKKDMELAITNAIREFEEKHQGVRVDSISVITTKVEGSLGRFPVQKNVTIDLKISDNE